MDLMMSIVLMVTGVIHVLPVSGVLGASRLETLYGVSIEEPNVQLMMRHRAVLFGVLGVFLIGAAWVPDWQTVAWAAGMVSVVSFLLLARTTKRRNAAVGRVIVVDGVALVCLCLGGVVRWGSALGFFSA